MEGTWSRNLDNDQKCEYAVASVCTRHLDTLEFVDFSNNKSSTELIAFNLQFSKTRTLTRFLRVLFSFVCASALSPTNARTRRLRLILGLPTVKLNYVTESF